MNWTSLAIKLVFVAIDLYTKQSDKRANYKAGFANWLRASNDSIIESVKAVKEDEAVKARLKEMGRP